ncbi:MAG TPA: chromosome segregation protein SMC [Myxococcaceae bacterium]|nr:chromosome segregation protein SMC [Myxococcaceae bacterium]
MHWVEFALQGVRGFLPSVRVSLKPGYWTLLPATAGAPLVGLTSELCFPDGRGGDARYAASEPGTPSKAALWLVGRDRATYRILRELGRSGSLHRVNATTRGHDLITEDPAEMAQYLRAQVGFPPRGRYEQLFTFTPSQLPSRRPKRGQQPPQPRLGGSSSPPTPEPPMDPMQARARLAELERELALSSEVERLQFRADGVTAQIFQLETRVKAVQELEQQLAEAQQRLQQAPTVEGLGLIPDIVERARGFPALVAKVDETLAKLEAERQVDVATAPAPAPLTRDGRFWAGMALGAAALFTGATVTGPLKYIALLDIPAFGLAALVALKRVEDLQWSELAVRKGDRLGDRERQVRDQFEADAQPVRNAMKILAVEQPHEIVGALEEHGKWAARADELEGRLSTAKLNPEYVAAASQLAELRAEHDALNGKLAEKGSYVRDAREVEREMARVRDSLAPGPRRTSTPGAPAAAGGPDALDDFTPALANAAADLLAIDVATLGARLVERCAQYVIALTERRVEGLEIGHDGKGVARVGGRAVPVGQLEARDVDWVWLGLRLSLLERLVAQEPMPVLLEDMGSGMDEARLPMLGRMLKALGNVTQLLHVTAHPVFASMSEGSLNV